MAERAGPARVVVVGSINVDLVVSVPHLPRPGETVLGSRFERHFGGKGANQAVAAARAGARVEMLGCVGRDPDGTDSLAALAAEGIDTSLVTTRDQPTGVALISVTPDGENQIAVAPGANALVTADDAAGIGRGPGVLLVSLEVPMAAVVAAVVRARAIGLEPIVNPAPAQPLPAELMAAGPLLIPNEHEALALIGAASLDQAVERLAAAGIGRLVVTRGARGALVVDGRERFDLPAVPVQAVDATGAGDTFAGVLATWLAEGAPLADAAAAANAAAAVSVTAAGARAGMPTRERIEALMRSRGYRKPAG
ncbi:MAG TPA: ribokinase [Candidatus Limnocylindria bacterium]